MIKRATGKTKLMYFPVTTSTAMNEGAFVIFTSGLIALATSTSTKIVGVLRKTIASTDSDYATARSVPVEVPCEPLVEWYATTASAVATDTGVAVDLTDETTVNRGGTTHHVVTISQVVSATLVKVVINALHWYVAGA